MNENINNHLARVNHSPISNEELQRWMNRYELTPRALARILGVSERTAQRYMSNGISDPPTCIAVRFVLELLGGLGECEKIGSYQLEALAARLGRKPGDFHIKSLERWWGMLSSLFEIESIADLPERHEWTDPNEIIQVLHMIGTQTSNHVFSPSGGGLDLRSARANEYFPGFIDMNLDNIVFETMIPAKLEFYRCLERDVDATYFLLENAPTNQVFSQDITRQRQELYISKDGKFASYDQIRDSYDEDFANWQEFQIHFLQSRFVIAHKGGSYNDFGPHYTPVQNTLSPPKFYDYARAGFESNGTTWQDQAWEISRRRDAMKTAKDAEIKAIFSREEPLTPSPSSPQKVRPALVQNSENILFVVEAIRGFAAFGQKMRHCDDGTWRPVEDIYVEPNDSTFPTALEAMNKIKHLIASKQSIEGFKIRNPKKPFHSSELDSTWTLRARPVYRKLPSHGSFEDMLTAMNSPSRTGSFSLILNHLGEFEFVPLRDLDINHDPSLVVRHQSSPIDLDWIHEDNSITRGDFMNSVLYWEHFLGFGPSSSYYCDFNRGVDLEAVEARIEELEREFKPHF